MDDSKTDGIEDVSSTGEQPGFEHWAILELMGHRRLAGKLTEATIAGGSFIRIDIPDGDGFATQFYAPHAVYAISPVSEAVARAAASRADAAPVHTWEFPKQLEAADTDEDAPWQ